MTDEQQRKRRVLIAIVSVIVLIGIGGVTAALLVDDGGSTSDPALAPGAAIDPLSVAGICRAQGTATYAVATGSKVVAEVTATAAVEKWVRDGETSQSTSTGEDTKLVAISRTGELPRVVLTVTRGSTGWLIEKTSACLDAATGTQQCTEEKLSVAKVDYTRKPDAPAGEAGAYVGNATLDSCPTQVEGEQLAARGVIAPVSAYAAKGTKGAVVVTDEIGTRLFTR